MHLAMMRETCPYSRLCISLRLVGKHEVRGGLSAKGGLMMTEHGVLGCDVQETDTVLLALNLGRLHRATSGTPTGSGAAAGTAAEESRGELGEAPPMPQLSLLPTLSLLMGLPIPYGSIGAASPHLWALSTAGLPPPAAARSFRFPLPPNYFPLRFSLPVTRRLDWNIPEGLEYPRLGPLLLCMTSQCTHYRRPLHCGFGTVAAPKPYYQIDTEMP